MYSINARASLFDDIPHGRTRIYGFTTVGAASEGADDSSCFSLKLIFAAGVFDALSPTPFTYIVITNEDCSTFEKV
jgi:hypothetical protein